MAGHNLSPRQKMINMMYLMLTAMLALNVSKEVLNAFATIDEGILKAVENTVAKNQSLWEDFETRKASQEKSEKVKKYFTIAKELRSKADEICEFILESKKEIVKTSEGADAEAITEDEVTVMDIKAKDKTEAPAQVMVGAEGRGGRGKELKKKIDELKSWLLNDIVDDDYEQLQESIESALFTGEIKHKDQVYDWVHGNFEHMPIAGVIAVLSSIENNVRNVETDVLNYLYGQIDVGTIKFNAIEAMAISNSNHVIRGNKYSARIFTAASDTSAKPLILIGDVKKDEEGKFDGFEGTPDTVPLGPGGKGIYEVNTAGKNGEQTYEGVIVIKKATGKTYRMFEQSYTVAPPQAVVSPTKMNVFYLGLDNPVDVSVAGIARDKVYAYINNGTMRKSRGGWVVRPRRAGKARVSVSAEIDGEKKSMGSKDFRVKVVPDPIPKVAGKTGGDIKKSVLQAQSFVIADIPDFLFDIDFEVVSFNLYTMDKAGFIKQERSGSKRITGAQKQIIKGLSRNQKVFFEEIKVKKPGGVIVNSPTLSFTVK